jgi:hypothetical protein
MIYSLKYLLVNLPSPLILKAYLKHHHYIREPLHPDPDRPVSHIRSPRFLARVVVVINDLIEVPRDDLGDAVERGEVEGAALVEAGERDRGEVAHCYLGRGGVLDHLAAQVRALDSPQVLVVRLRIRMVLVQHIRGTRFYLAVYDCLPEFVSLNSLATFALILIRFIEFLKLFSMAFIESLSFIGAKESPLAVVSDSLHKQVGNPESIEEVPRSLLLLAMILLELQKLEDVSMPRLEVYRERPLPLSPALIHISRGLIEHFQHRHQSVRVAVRALDVAA